MKPCFSDVITVTHKPKFPPVAIAEVTVPSAVGVILVLCVTVISVICIVLTLNRSGAKVSVEVAGETSNPERVYSFPVMYPS